jgi:AbrB family looped-hinge helix DNA binding protein
MKMVVISPDYRIAIPRQVCERLGLRPGQELQVMEYDGRIELLPLRPAAEQRGFLRGMNPDFAREPDRF